MGPTTGLYQHINFWRCYNSTPSPSSNDLDPIDLETSWQSRSTHFPRYYTCCSSTTQTWPTPHGFFIWKSLPRDLCRLNTCHLFLGVTLLSNITCPCGRYIYQDSIIGRKDVIPSSRMLYLYQDSPNSASWKLWAKALAPLLHPRTLSLRQPLTRWIVTGGESIRKWPVFIHTNHSGVYIPNNADFSVHPLSHRTVHYNISYITSHLPSCAIPAEFADHYHRTLLLFVSHVTIHATSTCSRLWIITENYAPLGVCSLTQSDTNWEPIY